MKIYFIILCLLCIEGCATSKELKILNDNMLVLNDSQHNMDKNQMIVDEHLRALDQTLGTLLMQEVHRPCNFVIGKETITIDNITVPECVRIERITKNILQHLLEEAKKRENEDTSVEDRI